MNHPESETMGGAMESRTGADCRRRAGGMEEEEEERKRRVTAGSGSRMGLVFIIIFIFIFPSRLLNHNFFTSWRSEG